ncbi:hypothetical protein BDP27DRAFT_1442577 [Rhodocollybia butyracea]|uniref:Uncharacterized protein n=1 Tax=Rhodocollybia butyracea TaxID=206335 RepID=A0A9P5Q8C4_9AGAR|nr:hypothetical protein BDP27DRAFT_1442577 [Rhodocollybia butyracea]
MNDVKLSPTVASAISPARRRSSTFTGIANWALTVQPGSPAPISPPLYSPAGSPGIGTRRPSLPRRPSLSVIRGIPRRRPSITHTRARSGSSSFLHLVETPTTPAHKSPSNALDFDLTDLGYNSVFVPLPHTPSTPFPFVLSMDTTDKVSIPIPPIPQTPPPRKGLKKFRSLGMLKGNRKHGKPVAAPTSSTTTRLRSQSRSGSVSPSSPTHAHRSPRAKPVLTPPPSTSTFKKAKKASAATAPPLPPTLANELLLMQFLGGGSLETHAKRVMESQAKDTLPAGKPKGAAPVGTVYRDELGNMWWDAEEAIEYQALLPPTSPDSPGRTWVVFGPSDHRGSLVSSSALSSIPSSPSLSLSLNNVITPAPLDGTSARAMHLLRLPALSPAATEFARNITLSSNLGLASASGAAARNKRNRRRPAPLKLHSAPVVPTTSANANVFDDSFAPAATRRVGSGSGDLSAPAACADFATETAGSKAAPKSSTKLRFKSKAKALFGGH